MPSPLKNVVVRCSSIDWVGDDLEVDLPPDTVTLVFEGPFADLNELANEVNEEGANILSDKYGFLVKSFCMEFPKD